MVCELFLFTPSADISRWKLSSRFFSVLTKLDKIFHTSAMIWKNFANFVPEAEEEAGSAEEQPASNRLSRHTEIVTSGVAFRGWAHYFRRRLWLKKPNAAQPPRLACPMDFASTFSEGLFAGALLRAFGCQCSCAGVQCCKTV